MRACSMVHGRLIRAFAARAREAQQVTLDDVTQITRRMQDAGVSPDTITLNSALQVLLARPAPGTVHRTASEMRVKLLTWCDGGPDTRQATARFSDAGGGAYARL